MTYISQRSTQQIDDEENNVNDNKLWLRVRRLDVKVSFLYSLHVLLRALKSTALYLRRLPASLSGFEGVTALAKMDNCILAIPATAGLVFAYLPCQETGIVVSEKMVGKITRLQISK